jgi:hypothetical protein
MKESHLHLSCVKFLSQFFLFFDEGTYPLRLDAHQKNMGLRRKKTPLHVSDLYSLQMFLNHPLMRKEPGKLVLGKPRLKPLDLEPFFLQPLGQIGKLAPKLGLE